MNPPEMPPPGGFVSRYLCYWAVWLLIVGGTWLFFRRTRGTTGVRRLVVGNLLVLAALLWTAVAVGETYVRYVYDQSDQYGLTMTNVAWYRRHMRLNSRGFRDREWPRTKAPGVEIVACIGDSFTMGHGVRDPRDAFPQRIGAALETRFPGRFDVRNLGEGGVATGQEADTVDEVRRFDAVDRIVLGYCLNDIDDLLPRGRRFERGDLPQLPVDPDWSYLADFLWFRLKVSGDARVRDYFAWEKEAYEDPAIWGRQRDRFRRIAESCRESAIRLHVVVFPLFSQWGEGYSFDGCHDRIAEAWRSLGVDVVDLREAYRGVSGSDLVVNRFDAHPNERAHEIAADAILERAFGGR
jgi:hypothetical protein